MSCAIASHAMVRTLNDGHCPICVAPAVDEPFHVVVADPAWPFDDKLPGEGRGAEKHYDLMSIDDICRMTLPPLAHDCHLFLWRVSSMVEEAYRVVRAWDFVPKSEVVWHKLTKNGKRHFGMGRHVRAEHETCIIATRGRAKVRDMATRSIMDAPAPLGFEATASRVHSTKPDEFFALVEKLCWGPYVELFARHTRPGWTTMGSAFGDKF